MDCDYTPVIPRHEALAEGLFNVHPERRVPPRPLVLSIRSQETNLVEFETAKQSHGFCNLLRRILLNDERVILAAYKFDYFNPPRFIVELHDPKQIKTVLLDATKRMRESIQDLEKGLAKI